VFGATENNNKTENIFGLTKKTSLVSENSFRFKIYCKLFFEFEFLILKLPELKILKVNYFIL
jgi:hypothetical protein